MGAVEDFLAAQKKKTDTGFMSTLSAQGTQPTTPSTEGKPEDVPAYLQSLYDTQRGVPKAVAPVDQSAYTPQHTATPQQGAQDNVDLEYNQRIRMLQQTADAAARGADQSMNEQKIYGREVDPRIANIYGALQNSLGQNRDSTQQGYQSAIDKIRGYYDQAGQANQGLNSDLMARITGDAERWGVGAAIPGGTQKLNDTYQFDQLQNNNAKAGRSANLAQLAAQIQGLDTGRISSAAQEGAQQRASLQNEIAKTLGQLGVSSFEEQGNYRNQIQGLGQDKATALRQELEKLTNQRSGEGIDARKNALQEFLALSGNSRDDASAQRGIFTGDRNFDQQVATDQRDYNRSNLESDRNYQLSRDQFGNTVHQQNFDNQIQLDQLAMQRESLAAQMSKTQNPLEQQKLQAEINKLDAQTAKISGTSGTSTNNKFPPGQAGLSEFYKLTDVPWWGIAGAGPHFRETVDKIVGQTLADQNNPTQLGAGRSVTDPYQHALLLASSPGYASAGIDPDALKTALQVYYRGLK